MPLPEERDRFLNELYKYVREEKAAILEEVEAVEERLRKEAEKVESRAVSIAIDKLNALKELINQSTTARQETVIAELSRIQRENGICAGRCELAKSGFTKQIKDINDELDKLKSEAQTKNLTEFQHKELSDRITILENWKSSNWARTVTYIGAATIVSIQALYYLYNIIEKVHPVIGAHP